jgi:hypothetical protein
MSPGEVERAMAFIAKLLESFANEYDLPVIDVICVGGRSPRRRFQSRYNYYHLPIHPLHYPNRITLNDSHSLIRFLVNNTVM